MRFEEKIIGEVSDAISLVTRWKDQGLEVVFTNGCFDLIHAGHIDYLYRAAMLGDRLVVGLNSDKSVQKLKGKNRPVNDERTRSHVLAAFSFVDAVIFFEDETPLELIKLLKPDALIKGSDYVKEEIVGYEVLVENGGKVETIPFLEGYSSTSTIEKIRKWQP